MTYEDIIKRAKEAAAQQNYDYAITLLYDIVQADPRNREARALLRDYEIQKAQKFGQSAVSKVGGFMRGIVSKLGKKDPAKAINTLEAALKDDPTNITLLLQLARALRDSMLPEQAIDTLEAARMVDNQNKSVLAELVDLYDSIKEYEKAQARASDYLKLDPHDQVMAEKLKNVSAKLHMERTRLEQTKSFREQVRDLKKHQELERSERLVLDEQEIEEGIKKAKIAIRRNPRDHVAYVKLGDLLQRKGELMKALKCYDTAYKISGEFPIREKLGDLAIRIHHDNMIKARERLEKNPENPTLKEEYEKARERYLKASLKEYEFRVKSHPTDLGARFKLAMALYENGDYDRAAAEFQNTVQDPRVRLESQKYLGLCFMKKNLPDLAVNQFLAALKNVKPGAVEQEKELNYYLGEAYEQMGEIDKAYATFQKIFETDISYKDVAQKLSDLRVKVKGG